MDKRQNRVAHCRHKAAEYDEQAEATKTKCKTEGSIWRSNGTNSQSNWNGLDNKREPQMVRPLWPTPTLNRAIDKDVGRSPKPPRLNSVLLKRATGA